MANKKCLILLINDFPFDSGEPFFERELPFLSTKFEKIVIFSVCGNKHLKPTRQVEENVLVYPLSFKHNRLKNVIRGVFTSNKLFNINDLKGKKRITGYYMKGKSYFIAKNAITIFSRMNDSSYDYYIYSYWLTLAMSAVILTNYIKMHGFVVKNVISRCHRYDIYNELHPFNFIPFQKESIDYLDAVYSCSEHGKNYLLNRYPNFANKIHVSRLFSEDHGIQYYSPSNKNYHFLTVSGFRPVKRLDLFAKAFSIVAKKRNDVYWLAIGNGESLDDVKNIVKSLGVEDKVSFLGSISNTDVYKFYMKNQIYFFCNVSSSEGVPVSIMEATSFGVPILATNVGGNSEIVDNSNGVLIDKDISVEELANALEKCLNMDKNYYFQLRKNSREKWEEKYNQNTNLISWCKCLANKN